MNEKQARTLVVIFVALLVLLLFFSMLVLLFTRGGTKGAVGFLSWEQKLRLVSQPGRTERYVVSLMGKPDAVETPQDAQKEGKEGVYGSMPIPKGTVRVYYYEYGFGVSAWMGYIFIGENGEVLGHYLRET
jgi:hypothetical protein